MRGVELERSCPWVGDPARHRIRPDIELLDGEERTLVVVECKAPGIPLGGPVEQQAREYAVKSGARDIWISNGDAHKFLIRKSRGTWEVTNRLEPLETDCAPPPVNFDFPDANDDKSVRGYFERCFPDQGYTDLDSNDQWIVLSFHKLLFDMPKSENLPFSYRGVHVLEDRDADYHEFGNASGGRWRNLYGDFIVATSGRVEALSVAAGTWRNWEGAGIRLCVGVRKAGRIHHALQMDLKDCAWDEERQCWRVYHDGRMSRIRRDTVFAAVEESGAGDWLETHERKTWLYLGDLHWAESATWGKLPGVLGKRAALRADPLEPAGRPSRKIALTLQTRLVLRRTSPSGANRIWGDYGAQS